MMSVELLQETLLRLSALAIARDKLSKDQLKDIPLSLKKQRTKTSTVKEMDLMPKNYLMTILKTISASSQRCTRSKALRKTSRERLSVRSKRPSVTF